MNVKVVYPGQFVAWVTCMLQAYEDCIIAGMVRKGYIVSICSIDGKLTHGTQDNPAVIITFRCDTTDEKIAAKDIHTDLVAVLRDMKAMYYSVVVSALSDACWIGSNIALPKSPPPPIPQVPEPNKTNLN
jgi:hypothetical protein